MLAHKSSSKTQEYIISEVVSYRSASCGCCKKWINHLRDNGLDVVEDISEIKNQHKITNNLRSCHSAKIGNYIIEGHVPIESINKLLKDRRIIVDIAVPGMPHDSPGMEIHLYESHSHDYESYEIISFIKNRKTKIFEKISP